MNAMKFLFGAALVVLLAALASTDVSANAYNGYNSIGSYYQYGHSSSGGNWNGYVAQGGPIYLADTQYSYPTTPRGGGWYGSGTGWLMGLRTPYYGCVQPIHNSYLYRPSCGGGSYWGSGYGYNRPTFNDRTRSGGFVY